MKLRDIKLGMMTLGIVALTCACDNKPQQRQPFAEAADFVCPDGARRVEIRETSYPEFYCVGEKGRTGTWLEFDVNGRLRKRGEYKDGKLNGPWIAYHADGSVETSGQMVNDERTGVWTQTYVNGVRRSEKSYKNNQLDGPIKLYYMTGELMAEGGHVAGIEEGPWKVYKPDGKLARECMLVHGEEKDCVVHDKDFQITTYQYESKERGPL